MTYVTSHITDIGTSRKTNQDALRVKSARTSRGQVLLAAVADGVGGLRQGELASNTMTHDLARWFQGKLPSLMKEDALMARVQEALNGVLLGTHQKLQDYMRRNSIQLGTTAAVLFLHENQYQVLHVGDTRVYCYEGGKMCQLTKDHTYVQREMDAGRMTRQQADASQHRNVLTQCIGSVREMTPEVHTGVLGENALFLICSDGFRNQITETELKEQMADAMMCTSTVFERIPVDMVNRIKERGEKDNISAIFVKYTQEK